MKTNPSFRFSFRHCRLFIAFLLCAIGGALGLLDIAVNELPNHSAPTLRLERLSFPSPGLVSTQMSRSVDLNSTATLLLPADAPTFGHPIIAGIGGTGFEESIRI